MNLEQFLEQASTYLGGTSNISRTQIHAGNLHITVKDSGVVDMDALSQMDGVVSAELSRGKLTIATEARNDLEELRMVNYEAIAKEILQEVGGEANVSDVSNCMTRLRFHLFDNAKANLDAIKSINGVVGVQIKSGQLQVIIGPEVSTVFEALPDQIKEKKIEVAKEEGNLLNRVISMFSGFFIPLVPAMCGAGIIKCIMAFAVQFNWMNPTGDMYAIFNMISDGVFYFLPFFLAVSVAERLKVNKFLALGLAAMLLYPTLVNGIEGVSALSFLGLPVPLLSYTTSVIPIILSVLCLKYVWKLLSKFIPKSLELIVTAGLSLLITGVITLVALAPLGTYLGEVFSTALQWLYGVAGPIASTLFCALFPLLVITGMAYSVLSVTFFNLATLGYDYIMLPIMIMSNVNQGIANFAVALKTKSPRIRSMSIGTGVTAIMGITEPAMYSVNLVYKTPFYAAMAGNAVAGLIAGLFQVKMFAFAGSGILTMPAYMSADYPSNFMWAVIGMAAGAIVTFILTWISTPKETLTDK